jgi:hypothetical protein
MISRVRSPTRTARRRLATAAAMTEARMTVEITTEG